MPYLFECTNCDKEIEDEEIKVRFPNIPNLFERMEPGEPVPFGECPTCGVLVHEAEPIPGKRAFVSVNEGKFEVTVDNYNKHFAERTPDCITDDPEVAREFMIRARVDHVSYSSSVDFPDEYGMDPVKVEQLFGSR